MFVLYQNCNEVSSDRSDRDRKTIDSLLEKTMGQDETGSFRKFTVSSQYYKYQQRAAFVLGLSIRDI